MQLALEHLHHPQDAKINSMERSFRDMEEELLLMKSNGLLSCEERQEEMKQMEVYRSHTKFMKSKVRQNLRFLVRGIKLAVWNEESQTILGIFKVGNIPWVLTGM